MNKEKIIFFGTSKISVQCLEEFLKEKSFSVELIITKKYSDLEKFAQKKEIKVLNELNQQKIAEINPDKFAVVDFGVIIPDEILKLSKKGAYNLHFSLLPKYRGASPVQSAILNRDKISGVSIIEVVKKLDAGKIFAQKELAIENLRADEVFEKMLKIGAPLFVQTVKNPGQGEDQDENQATFCGKISKKNGLIEPKKELVDDFIKKVNAYYPWPSVYFEHEKLGLLKILRAKKANNTQGKELFKENKKLFLELKDGIVEILEIQREGRKKITGEEFARGMQ